jgi:alanine dehydrogenase
MQTLILSGDDVAELLGFDECIVAVEDAFRAHGEGRVEAGVLSAHAERGAFHIKTAVMDRWFAAKLNANYPGNPASNGLPAIQGVLVLFDATNGFPVAVMDSGEVTTRRTAAATAVAAKHLARRDARTAMICGCGRQAAAQLTALRHVFPLERVTVFDLDQEKAKRFAQAMDARVGPLGPADILVTCTPSRKAFVSLEHLAPGTFVAAVGADNPEKSEIEPEVMRASGVVADVLEQSATIGDLRTAIAAGAMTRDDVRAELGAIVAGRVQGRLTDDEIIIFDSTGAGFQDTAAAALVYERAIGRKDTCAISFASSSPSTR